MWRWDQQEPFGNNVPDENPSGLGTFDLPLRLPGQYFDKETNLHYNYFRNYDPSIGRYGESDLIGLLGGLNTYAYGRSDPLRRTDPTGLFDGSGMGLVAAVPAVVLAAAAAPVVVSVVTLAAAGGLVAGTVVSIIGSPAANDPNNPDCDPNANPDWDDYCIEWRDALILRRFHITLQEAHGLDVRVAKRIFNKERARFCRACTPWCDQVRPFD